MSVQIHRCSDVDDCFHPKARDVEIIRLVSLGWPRRRIADALGIADNTLKNYMSRLYDGIQASDRASLVRRAYELGLLAVPQVGLD